MPTDLDTPAGPRPRPGVWGVVRDRTFQSLQSRDYRLYFTGQIVSLTGSWMQSAALMWLTYAATGDPLWPPLMLVAQTAPTLVLGPWAGALADRVARRKLVIVTQSCFLANAVLLTGLVASDRAAPWLLFAVQLVNGVIQAVDLPARLAFVPTLVPRAALVNAVALNSLVFNAARAVGPAVAGGLFVAARRAVEAGLLPHSPPVALGAVGCFTLNGLSFLVVLAALRAISVAGVPTPAAAPAAGVLAGFRAVRADRRLVGLLAATGGVSLFAWPTLTLFPAYTATALGHAEAEYTQLLSALGAGALVAALLNATFATPARRGLFLSLGAVAAAAGTAGVAVAPTFGLAVAASAALGAGLVLHLSTAQSTLQLSVPDGLRGRVMAIWPMLLSASTLAGQLLAGSAAEALPVRTVLAGMAAGAAVAAAGVTVWASRAPSGHGPPAVTGRV